MTVKNATITLIPILQKLIQKQLSEGLSDYKFAHKMGIKRPIWTLTRNGNRPLSMTVLRATARTYPELKEDIFEFLRSEDHDSTD